MEDNKEIQKVGIVSNSPASMITLEKLLTLQERWEANEAKKAYNVAMAEFKANPPKIDKDKTVAYDTSKGKTSYHHASLANVTDKINEALSKYGLSASWFTKQNGEILVTCKIAHIMGHSEETTLSAPADTSGSKNSIQAIGSTITYLCRYTLLCLTGLATEDQDDDGNSAGVPVEYINEKEVNQLLDCIAELKIDEAKFLAYMKITKLEEMPKSEFKKAMIVIENKRKAQNAKGN